MVTLAGSRRPYSVRLKKHLYKYLVIKASLQEAERTVTASDLLEAALLPFVQKLETIDRLAALRAVTHHVVDERVHINMMVDTNLLAAAQAIAKKYNFVIADIIDAAVIESLYADYAATVNGQVINTLAQALVLETIVDYINAKPSIENAPHSYKRYIRSSKKSKKTAPLKSERRD